jgi:hypothetical protein
VLATSKAAIPRLQRAPRSPEAPLVKNIWVAGCIFIT